MEDEIKEYLSILKEYAKRQKREAEDGLEDVRNPVVNGSAVGQLSHKLSNAEGQLQIINEIEDEFFD